jgi:hypothetical protein
MANIKITDLTAYTDPLNTDVLPIVDVTSDTTKKVSIADLLKNASAGTAAAPGIAFDGDNTGIYSPGADQVAISTNGTGRLFIDAAGRIGVGNLSPGNQAGEADNLVVGGGSGDTGISILSGTSSEGGLYFADGGGGSAYRGKVIYDHATDSLQLDTAGSERLRITSDGKLGLGTSNPTNDRLHIRESVAAGISLEASGTGGSTWRIVSTDDNASLGGGYLGVNNGGYRFVINSAGNVGIGTTSPDGLLTLNATPSNTPRLRFQNQSVDADAAISTYADTNGTNLLIGSNAYVNSAGAVSKFDAGEESAHIHLTRTGTIQFYAGNTTTESARITSDGKLGLGTSTPDLAFHISRNTGAGLKITDTAVTNASWEIRAQTTNTTKLFRIIDSTAGLDRLTIDSSGRVGIGTTSPGAKLNIAGDDELLRLNHDNAFINFRNTADNAQLGFIQMRSSDTSRIWVAASQALQFATANTERVRIDSSGRLLVGTSSTAQTSTLVLQGRGSATGSAIVRASTTEAVPGDGLGLGSLYFCNSAHATVSGMESVRDGGTWTNGTSHPSRLTFFTTAAGASSPTERLRIDSAGNVGIGTASPSSHNSINRLLNIDGATNAKTGISLSEASANYFDIYFDGSNNEAHIDQSAGGGLVFTSGANEAFRVDSSQRLLVGTSTAFDTNSVFEAVSTSNVIGQFCRTNGVEAAVTIQSTPGTLASPTPNNANASIGALYFRGYDTASWRIAAKISAEADGQTWAAGDCPGRLVFSTTADGASSPTERMTIKNDGKVGIGVTSPGANLQVQGSGTSDVRIRSSGASAPTSLQFWARNSADNAVRQSHIIGTESGLSFATATTNNTTPTERLRVDTSGRLLVGTSTEGNANADDLTISNSGNCGMTIRSGSSNAGVIYFSDATSGTAEYDGYIHYQQSAQFLSFGTAATERARLDSSGRLLVGTSSNFGAGADNRDTIVGLANAGAGLLLGRNDTSTSEGNNIGKIEFWGNDSDGEYEQCASIIAEADSDHGTGDKPTRLAFSTTADGASSPAEQLRITSDRYVRLASGTGGIQFNGDTAAANALDDYEEGTFTPTITQGVTSPTYGGSNTGAYRIIGKQLFFSLRVQLTGGTADANQLVVGGLPFNALPGSVYLYPQIGRFQSGASNTSVVGTGQASQNSLSITDASDRTIVTGVEATNTLDLQITGSYPVG